jgi:hypothetical protein
MHIVRQREMASVLLQRRVGNVSVVSTCKSCRFFSSQRVAAENGAHTNQKLVVCCLVCPNPNGDCCVVCLNHNVDSCATCCVTCGAASACVPLFIIYNTVSKLYLVNRNVDCCATCCVKCCVASACVPLLITCSRCARITMLVVARRVVSKLALCLHGVPESQC